jgi:hypothetical protein
MSLGNIRLNKIGEATPIKLPDGRKRFTRRWEVIGDFLTPARIESECFQLPGTPDGTFENVAFTTPGGVPSPVYPECLLIDQGVTNDKGVRNGAAVLYKTYEEIHPTEETQVGKDSISQDANGRRTLTRQTIQFSINAYAPGAAGTSATIGGVVYALNTAEQSDNGTLRTITRSYIEATNTLTQIGRDTLATDANNRAEMEREYIQLASAGYVRGTIGSTATSGVLAFVLEGETKTENEAVRKVTRRYKQATATWTRIGPIKTDRQINGLLRLRTKLIAAAGTTPPALAMGTTYLDYGSPATRCYLAGYTDEESTEAVSIIDAEYLQPGVVSRSKRDVEGGLVDVTVRSFYAKNAPTPGIVMYEDEDNENGYPIWVTTVRQKANGTSPTTGVADTFGVMADFTYPGVATFYQITGVHLGITIWIGDMRLSPPIDCKVEATATVSFSTSSELPTISPARWNPTSWASLTARWLSAGLEPESKAEGLRGYRAAGNVFPPIAGGLLTIGNQYVIISYEAGDDFTNVGAASNAVGVEFTATGTTPTDWSNGSLLVTTSSAVIYYPTGFDKAAFFGRFVYAGSTFPAVAWLVGGPPDPSGESWTLSYRVDPAFTAADGTKYYRHLQVVAEIP